MFLTDFGIAKDVATASKYTRTGQMIGTPDYASPEQVRGELVALGAASDVWSLGCVLYELLTARPPFTGDTVAGLVGAVVTLDPVPLRRLRRDVPASVERVASVCLRKSSRDRYADARTLRMELELALAGFETHTVRRRAWPWMAALAIGVLLALGFALWATSRSGSPPALDPPGTALAARARRVQLDRPLEATRLYFHALRAAPERSEWRLERGMLLWWIGRDAEARAEWERAAEAGQARATLYLGLEAMFDRRPNAAGEWLEQASEGQTRSARLARAALLLAHRQWPAARAALRDADGWEGALLRGYLETSDPAGDKAEGIRHFTSALEEGIPMALAYVNRGWTRFELGDLKGGIEDCAAALRLQPEMSAALNNRGWMRQAQRDFVRAIADFRAALAIDPADGRARNNLAEALFHTGKHQEALDQAGRLLPLPKHSQRAFAIRARALIGLGRPRDAVLELEEMVRRHPDDWHAWHDVGVARFESGDLDGAIQAYDLALTMEQHDAELWLNRGWARHQAGDSGGGEVDCARAIRINPRYADAWQSRGRIRTALKRYDEAVADFDRAIEIEPTHRDALMGRGVAREWLGRFREAIADYDAALDLDLGDNDRVGVLTNRAVCFLHLGRPRESEAALEAIVSQYASELRASSLLIRVRFDRQDWEGALAEAERFLRIAPAGHRWRAEVSDRAAECRRRLGR